MTTPEQREALAAEILPVFAGLVREAVADKTPIPSGESNLATAYWDGYRAAGYEIADLLEEPKLARAVLAAALREDTK